MGAGSPGIAYDVGGISEIITSPNLGWLIREGDSGAFLAAMSDAVQRSPEQLGRMGARARKQVLSHFASDVLLGRLANLIEFGREDGVQLADPGAKTTVGV
jgi:glycosyltransferase involved in cell wall biosynthesis